MTRKSTNRRRPGRAKFAGLEPRTILLVDDSPETRSIIRLYLTNLGFLVQAVPSAEDALASFDPLVHNAVVTDNSMQGMTGEELAHVVKMRSRSTPVIMYSGTNPRDRSCLNAIILKPAPLSLLREALEEHLK